MFCFSFKRRRRGKILAEKDPSPEHEALPSYDEIEESPTTSEVEKLKQKLEELEAEIKFLQASPTDEKSERYRRALFEAYGLEFMKKYAPECQDYIDARVRNEVGNEGIRDRHNTASRLRIFYRRETSS